MFNENDPMTNQLFKEFKWVDDSILVGTCHEVIQSEIPSIIDEMAKIKDSPLGFLRGIRDAASAVGNRNKRYLIPITITSNLALPYYIKHLGLYYLRKKYTNELDMVTKVIENDTFSQNMWMNFYTENEATAMHNHGGALSGIIYCSTNEKPSPTIFENGANVYGNFGDIAIFPASMKHGNPIYEGSGEDERITLAFNLDAVNLSVNND